MRDCRTPYTGNGIIKFRVLIGFANSKTFLAVSLGFNRNKLIFKLLPTGAPCVMSLSILAALPIFFPPSIERG